MKFEGAPNTPGEIVAAWDQGKAIWSIEMGGIGPGYEQTIQVLVVELLRAGEAPPPRADDKWSAWGDATVDRINASVGGFSGAQVGAAKVLAMEVFNGGMVALLNRAPADRPIQVSNFWPRAVDPLKRDLALGGGTKEWAEVVRCVDAFRAVMLEKLAKNQHKGNREGWINDRPKALLARVRQETLELDKELGGDSYGNIYGPELVREAADVANMAMMVADAAGALDVPPSAPDDGRPRDSQAQGRG